MAPALVIRVLPWHEPMLSRFGNRRSGHGDACDCGVVDDAAGKIKPTWLKEMEDPQGRIPLRPCRPNPFPCMTLCFTRPIAFEREQSLLIVQFTNSATRYFIPHRKSRG